MKKYLFLYLGLIQICFGCTFIRPPSILDNLVCEPPCWQNIIPGVTTEQEVLDIIAGLPDIDRDSIFNRGSSWSGYSNIIRFSFDNENYPVLVSIYFIDATVGLVRLDRNLGETISSVINKLGEPKNVFIVYQKAYLPLLFSEEIGWAIIYNDSDIPRKFRGNIHPEIEIRTIGFFNPESFSQILESRVLSYLELGPGDNAEKVFPWDGYGNIEEKYLP